MSKTNNNQKISFHVSGMHCASCAANVTRQLKKTEGVSSASVNYANEQAQVDFDEGLISKDQLAQVVKKTGYQAHISTNDSQSGHDHGLDIAQKGREKELKQLKVQLSLAGILTTILMVGAMLPIARA